MLNIKKIFLMFMVIFQFLKKERKLNNGISLFEKEHKIDKENYVVYIRALKQALNHGLMLLKKVHGIIQFNQEACLKEYIDMNIN